MKLKESINPYSDYRKSGDIHGTVLYPAAMVAPFQREIMEQFVDMGASVSVCDPFVGSGTSLYEAMMLSQGAVLYGCDINPLAVLITKVKLEGVAPTINQEIDDLFLRIDDASDSTDYSFEGIDKWFKPKIQKSLSVLRHSIMGTVDARSRRFFWVMLIDIIRKYSNSRSSTYKLHMRESAQIDRISNNVISDYKKKIRDESTFFVREENSNAHIVTEDSVAYLKSKRDNSFDFIITSPPYGDNATTVPYGQYSILALRWIDPRDLSLNGDELGSYSAIDSSSLGGWRNQYSLNSITTIPDEGAQRLICELAAHKQAKVIRFLNGYYAFLHEMTRVTREKAIITLGNRLVDGRKIDLVSLTTRYLSAHGMTEVQRVERDIFMKRTPPRVSRVNERSVSSMKTEIVLVFSKQQDAV